MTNYTKSTNFATKDSLASGNALKIVKGTEIDTEFNNIATAIATKSDSASPTFTGTVVIPTATITTANITTANISAGTITGITDLAIADGGTGASTAANARTNLGLVIGTNVQAWDTDLDTWATKTAPSGTVVGTSDTQTLTNKTLSTGTVVSASLINNFTTVASTSGTTIDFSSIPSWVKRITVMFQGVSTNGTSSLLIQGGNSGGIVSTGYASTSIQINSSSGTGGANATSGFIIFNNSASGSFSGIITLATLNGTNWVSSHALKYGTTSIISGGGEGSISTLTTIRIATSNGTDTFDAGLVNIMYE